MALPAITDRLVKRLDALSFAEPVVCVYNPLVYARRPFDAYCRRYGKGRREAVLMGMNPGPFGMVQTGVPFGDVEMVRDWLGIEERVDQPEEVHPKRPVEGFDAHRGEVSGQRFWGWARDRFGTPQRFFERFFVWNYCPLSFMEASGRNRTPDKLPRAEREALHEACDTALRELVDCMKPEVVIGIGKYAEGRLKDALGEAEQPRVGYVLHPSPASPAANQGWDRRMDEAMKELGIAT
jgi:single-strand selective monofunctional uracil DNA glycosylase